MPSRDFFTYSPKGHQLSLLLLLTFCCLLLAPSLLMAAGLASSLAMGSLLAGVLAISSGFAVRQRLRCVRMMIPWLLLFVLAIAVHLLVAGQFGNLGVGRALSSLVMLATLAFAAATLADRLMCIPAETLSKLMRRSVVLLLILGALGCARILQPFGEVYPKPVFPFTEPSHFGMFLTPILIAACVTSSKHLRILFIALVLTETAILQNMTMAVGCFIAAITCLPLRNLLLLLLLLLSVPSITGLDLTYYMSRVNFSEENTNISALVFLQGWQLLEEAWDKTHGFGLGFQQLGVNGSEVDAALLIQSLVGDDQNLKDGGFGIAKIVSEFGVFGVAMLMAYSFAAIKSVLLLRAAATRNRLIHPIHLIASSFVIGYAVELLVRGGGYFTPSGVLMLVGLFIRFGTPASNKATAPYRTIKLRRAGRTCLPVRATPILLGG